MGLRKFTFRSSYLFYLLIVAAALILVNAIADRHSARYDFTKDKLFSVSDATRQIFKKLEDPVEVTFYLSKKVPDQIKNLRRDTIDKFKEFEIISNGKFKWEVIEADKDQETLNNLRRYGIPELEGWVIRQDMQQGIRFYSGLVLNYMDKREIVPEFYDIQQIEYDIARKILQLTMEGKPLIKFFTSIKQEQPPPNASPKHKNQYDQYSAILDFKDVDEKFSVKRIKLAENDTVDSLTACLVIAQPQKLSKRQKYEINKYLSEGGSVIMFVAKRTVKRDKRMSFEDINPDIDDLFKHWGLTVEDKLVADMSMGSLVMTSFQGGGMITRHAPIPLVVKARGKEGLNQQSPITRRLENMNFPWVAPIQFDKEKLKELGLEATPLVQSSDNSWILTNPSRYLSDIRPPADKADLDGKQILALLVTGKFPFYYADRPVPQWPKEDEEEGESKDTAANKETGSDTEEVLGKVDELRKGKLLLVSSVDLIKYEYLKTFQMDPSYQKNIFFFLNSIELFSLGPELIDIRMKSQNIRRLDETTSNRKLMHRMFNVGLVPVLIILVGIVRFVWRRSEKKAYLKNLKNSQKTEQDQTSE